MNARAACDVAVHIPAALLQGTVENFAVYRK